MSDVTQILSAIEQGDPKAAEELLPLVYEELRKLAAAKMAQEKPGQTLQATELVHEAYLRLVNADEVTGWDSRGHFFASAAEAMRRILVDNARARKAIRRGGGRARQQVVDDQIADFTISENVLALDEALEELAGRDADAAKLVKLRYFAGLTSQQAAACLGVSSRTADRIWSYARSFLLKELQSDG